MPSHLTKNIVDKTSDCNIPIDDNTNTHKLTTRNNAIKKKLNLCPKNIQNKIQNLPNFITINGVIIFLLAILAGFLPLQNLLIQTGTKIFQLGDWLVLWKDLVIGIIGLLMLINIIWNCRHFGSRVPYTAKLWIFLPMILVLILNILALIASMILNQFRVDAFIFGYYFELWWVNFFGLTISWWNQNSWKIQQEKSQTEVKMQHQIWLWWLEKSMIIGFLVVSLITILSAILGQNVVLGWFGYSKESPGNSSLISTTPSCHLVDYGVDFCRSSGTFTHPIHFAGYLLLILPILLIMAIQFDPSKNVFDKKLKIQSAVSGNQFQKIFNIKQQVSYILEKFGYKKFYYLLAFLGIIFIFMTVSRYAFFGLLATVCVIILNWWLTNKTDFDLMKTEQNSQKLGFKIITFLLRINSYKLILSKIIILGILCFVLISSLFITTFNPENLPPLPGLSAIIKPSSSVWHFRHTMSTWDIIKESNGQAFFGFGLGSVGSAARTKYQDLNQNPVATGYEYVAYRWYFVKETFTLTENWFLQTLLNGGLFYTILYIWLVAWPLGAVYRMIKKPVWNNQIFMDLLVIAGYVGVIAGNMLEHLWENQTIVAYWTILFVWWSLKKYNLEHKSAV